MSLGWHSSSLTSGLEDWHRLIAVVEKQRPLNIAMETVGMDERDAFKVRC
jgi:hypothetical protein